MPVDFFSLPAELRNYIYTDVLASAGETIITQPIRPSIPTSFFLTCSQIYKECYPLLWNHHYWQSHVSYTSCLFDFRDPILSLPPPRLLPFLQNLEITIHAPRASVFTLDPEDGAKRQKEISGMMGELLAIVVDEIVARRSLDGDGLNGDSTLKNLRVRLPCFSVHCQKGCGHHADNAQSEGEPSANASSTESSIDDDDHDDNDWKAGVTLSSLRILLQPLLRLRVSHRFSFHCHCNNVPSFLPATLSEIGAVVVGGTPISPIGKEMGVFRDLWNDAREKKVDDIMVEDCDLLYSFWDMDHGFEDRGPAGWMMFCRTIYEAKRKIRELDKEEC
ncbi:MAG: hypothetical protein Q9169_006682, partial [Polycauliona sp. 2 TL-2023]